MLNNGRVHALRTLNSNPCSYLEVGQSRLGQRDVLHQEVAVFTRYIRRVEDVDLSGAKMTVK